MAWVAWDEPGESRAHQGALRANDLGGSPMLFAPWAVAPGAGSCGIGTGEHGLLRIRRVPMDPGSRQRTAGQSKWQRESVNRSDNGNHQPAEVTTRTTDQAK